MNKLKSCPFCGGTATYYRAEIKIKGKSTDTITIKCSNCESRSKRFKFDGSMLSSQDRAYNAAAALWNRRVNND